MKDYSVFVYFEDGKIVCYDMSQMIEKEAFCLLKDLDINPDTLCELPFVSERIA